LWLWPELSLYHFGTHINPKFSSIHHPSGLQSYHKKLDGKEKCMPNDFENRVLVRANARQLSAEEFQEIMEKGKSQMTQLPSMPFHPDF
jgi:hypothetical protein